MKMHDQHFADKLQIEKNNVKITTLFLQSQIMQLIIWE